MSQTQRRPHRRGGSSAIDRRALLRAGALGGLALPQLLQLSAASAAADEAGEQGARRANSEVNCIFVFIVGGMPHQDMWDLKPNAPAEIRGDFRPIATQVPGIQISDVLPKIAKVTDKLAILRSVTHTDSDHGRGFHVMMTGKKAGAGDFNGNQNNNQHPCLGSMVARLGRVGELPPYISVPNFLNSGGASFLGPSYGPFVIDADPAAPNFAVRDITLPPGVNDQRHRRRQSALQRINAADPDRPRVNASVESLDAFYQKAHSLMTSARAKQAFEIERESKTLRESYGATSLGQCCLLARRLIEAGCRFVSIENGHWDTHRKNTYSLRELLCPAFDQALPALLTDLENRGMLDSTLVVVTTEFGRTPRINPLAGRDHWPNAFSIVMAGAGLKRGLTIGATDRTAAAVADRPISPEDVTATVLQVLGINPKTVLHTPLGRPVPLVDGGTPIAELFA